MVILNKALSKGIINNRVSKLNFTLAVSTPEQDNINIETSDSQNSDATFSCSSAVHAPAGQSL